MWRGADAYYLPTSSRNRKENKGRRERTNHRREDADQLNAIVVEQIIL